MPLKVRSKRLASLAVFRNLYDNETDIYGVISEFLQEIIANNGLHQFAINQVTYLLNEEYDFTIPEAVINTALKRLPYVQKNSSFFKASPLPKIKKDRISKLQTSIKMCNELIFNELFEFIEIETEIQLDEPKKQKIINDFCSFMLDEEIQSNYTLLISSYIIKNQKNLSFMAKLNKIREGVILYSGITYNNNLNEVGSWDTELTIYLDTEVLFNFAGYNGELFKSLFKDFYKYVNEINGKKSKRLIRLRYFEEVESEIDGFFAIAKRIVQGKAIANPKNTAMSSILDGCTTISDIEIKKSDFFQFLKISGIQKDSLKNYYSERNHKFNIVDQASIELISEDLNYDISEHINFLNYIHINRNKEYLNNFINIKCILLLLC